MRADDLKSKLVNLLNNILLCTAVIAGIGSCVAGYIKIRESQIGMELKLKLVEAKVERIEAKLDRVWSYEGADSK